MTEGRTSQTRQDVGCVLIVNTAFLGDSILTTPLIRECKRSFPEAHLTFMAVPSSRNVLETNPHIDELIIFDKYGKHRGATAFLSLAGRLRRAQFDLALLPHRSMRTTFLAKAARIPLTVGFETGKCSFTYSRRVPYDRALHEVDRNLSILEAAGGAVAERHMEVFRDESDVEGVEVFLQGHNREIPLVALAPGSVWATKRWPVERFAALAQRVQRKLGAVVVLIGGPDEVELGRGLVREVGDGVLSSVGHFSVRGSAELISRCAVLVGNDSAPLHLAASVGTPVVGLLGPLGKHAGFAPRGPRDVAIEMPVPCRPCGKNASNQCPEGTFECMRSIEVNSVYAAVEQAVAARRAKECVEPKEE